MDCHCCAEWVSTIPVIFHPRLQQYPGGCGKAFDTTLLCQWLLALVQAGNFAAGHVA